MDIHLNYNKMKSLLPILCVFLVIVSCKRDVVSEEANVTFTIKANFDGAPLTLYEEYNNVTDYGMVVEQLKLYLSDMRLVDDNGNETLLSELEYFDYSDGNLSRTFSIESGNYTALKCGLGVPTELNGTSDPDFDPVVYPPGHPLALANNMYWAWATGYRFMIFEGRVDTTPGDIDTTDFATTYSIHLGRDTTFLPLEFGINGNSEEFEIVADLDVSTCIYNESDTLYLDDPEDNAYHGAEIDVAMRFIEFLSASFEVSTQ